MSNVPILRGPDDVFWAGPHHGSGGGGLPDVPPPDFVDSGTTATVQYGHDPWGSEGDNSPLSITTADSGGGDPGWPTGPGVTDKVALYVDGQPPEDWGLLEYGQTYPTQPASPASQQDFIDNMGQALMWQIGATNLPPGGHVFSQVGLDSGSTPIWRLDAPYTVWTPNPSFTCIDSLGNPTSSGTAADLWQIFLIDLDAPPQEAGYGSPGFPVHQMPYSSFAPLGAVTFEWTCDYPNVFAPGMLTTYIPGTESTSWAGYVGGSPDRSNLPVSSPLPPPGNTVHFTLTMKDSGGTVVRSYTCHYTVTS